MNYDIYQKLKGEVKNKDFYSNYSGLVKFLWYVSFISNMFSVMFAYFHLKKIIEQAVDVNNTTLYLTVAIICVVILAGLELFKRFIFDKFSLVWIKNKFALKGSEMMILGLVSTLLIAASFYLSLHGASEYAAKSDEIKEKTEVNVQAQQDTLSSQYDKKILALEQSNHRLDSLKLEYDTRAEAAETPRDKRYYRNQVTEQEKLKTKNDTKIAELKKEKEAEIEKATKKITSKADETMSANQSNSVRFLVFSTVIEFLIILGVFFKNFFSHKSVSEYEDKMRKDPRYKNLDSYNKLVEIIYKPDSNIGDSLPYKTEIAKMLRLSQVDLVGKDLDDALKVFTHLGVLQLRGSKRILKMDKESAKEAIKSYLKID